MTVRSRLALAIPLLVGPLLVGLGCARPGIQSRLPETLGDPPTEAIPGLRASLDQNPGDPHLRLDLARALAASGQAEEAVQQFERAAEIDPGRRREVEKERARFLAWYQEAAKESIDRGALGEAERWIERADHMAASEETEFLRALLLQARGDSEGAIGSLRAAWEADPGDLDRQQAYSRALVAQAEDRYDAGRFREAWDLIGEAERVRPEGDYHYVKGTVAYAIAQSLPPAKGKEIEVRDAERARYLEWAAAEFEAVVRRERDDADARFNLASVYLAAGRFEDAAVIYRDLIAERSEDGDLYLALSRAHSYAGEDTAAAAEQMIGRALTGGQSVQDVAGWSEREARRFQGKDLYVARAAMGSPDAIYTHSPSAGVLVEVWIYRDLGQVEVFRDGVRVAAPYRIQSR